MIIPIPPTRQQLQAINQQTKKYPLDTAEKDYYLAAALSLIAQLVASIQFDQISPTPFLF